MEAERGGGFGQSGADGRAVPAVKRELGWQEDLEGGPAIFGVRQMLGAGGEDPGGVSGGSETISQGGE